MFFENVTLFAKIIYCTIIINMASNRSIVFEDSKQNTSRIQENLIVDRRGDYTDHYINLSSANRDKAQDPSSDDATYNIVDGIKDATSIEIINFEIPHTRYAIDSTNNTLYISEEVSPGVFNYFGLRVSTGGYYISNLAVSLELSTLAAVLYTEDSVMANTYSFLTSQSFGKVAIVSSGDVPYNIHTCKETLKFVKYTKMTDTEASVQFIAPYDNILAPGALLTMNVYDRADREVQVISATGDRTVTLIGDFSDIEDDDVDNEKSTLIPYSSRSSIAEVAGFGLKDLQIDNDTGFDVIGMGSPFSAEVENDVAKPMVLVNFPPFLSSDDYALLNGTGGFADGSIMRIGKTHDDTHFEMDLDITKLWSGESRVVSSNGNSWDVDSISFISSEKNLVVLSVSTVSPASVSVGDIVEFSGLTYQSEWENLTVVVSTIDVSSGAFSVSFMYSTANSFIDGVTSVSPINPDTGVPTTYIGPNRFDLSRGRRVIICRATIDGVDVGTLRIPNDPTKYFGRIQLFSGADLVNFLNSQSAIGNFRFPGRVKHLRTIRLRFVNEDGSPYRFENVDYTAFIKVRSSIGFVV